MPILALDTSGPRGWVAIGSDGAVRAERSLEVRMEHASHLLPAIDAVLEELGLEPDDLSELVVGEGPGSFTGVRVAGATAKGLVHVLGIPLRALSSMQAVAVAGAGATARTVRYALLDARGDRVYGACYAIDARGVEVLVEPHAARIGEVLAAPLAEEVLFTGDGALKHRALLVEAGFHVAEDAGRERLGLGLLRSVALGAAPVVDPTQWAPSYVRASSAERSRAS